MLKFDCYQKTVFQGWKKTILKNFSAFCCKYRHSAANILIYIGLLHIFLPRSVQERMVKLLLIISSKCVVIVCKQ